MRTHLFVLLVSIAAVSLPFATAVSELPRYYIDTAFPTQTGAITVVPTTADPAANGVAFQAALNAAQPGDTIVLQAGATYVGNFLLPIKSGMSNSSWIVIRSTRYSELPPQGQRVQVTDRALMPELVSPNVMPAVSTVPGSPASGGYWFTGVFFTENSNYFAAPVAWSSWPAGTQLRYSYGLVALGVSGEAQNTFEEVPSRFTFDRCYFYGGPTSFIKRALELNSAWTAVVDSRIEGMKGSGQDTQAILGGNGQGPFKIVNNHLEGSGENVMFGGSDPTVPTLVPSDIEIRRNYIYKPNSWRGYWMVKNSYETKNNQRLLMQGNVVENNWADGQTGYMLVLKSSNQDGGCPWCVSQDVTIKNNIFKNSDQGFNFISGDDYSSGGVIPQNHITMENNLFLNVSWGEGRDLGSVVGGWPQGGHRITHNTVVGYSARQYSTGIVMDGAVVASGIVIRDNIFASLGTSEFPMMFFGSGMPTGIGSLNRYMTDWTVTNNAFVALSDTQAVPNNNYVARRVSDFVDAANSNFRLVTGSPLKGTASDGTDPGADWSVVLADTANAVTGIWGACTVNAWTPNPASFCGSVVQTSNCATLRTTPGGVTCSGTQTCVANACVTPAKIGDRNNDGRVDAIDLAILITDLGKTDSAQDLNGDHKVDVFDIVILTRDWS